MGEFESNENLPSILRIGLDLHIINAAVELEFLKVLINYHLYTT